MTEAQKKKHKSFWFRFFQKANGCGRSPQKKSEAEAKNERQSEAIKKKKGTVDTSRMQSIRRRAFTVPTYLHKEKYTTQRTQNTRINGMPM